MVPGREPTGAHLESAHREKQVNHTTEDNPRHPDYLLLAHRWSGLIGAPFLVLSILLAVGLSHAKLLDGLSERLYDSRPIPRVALKEAIQPGSWDQALQIAQQVTGARGQVITSRDENTLVVQAFVEHSHDPQVMKTNPHTHVVIDTRTMRVVDIRDKHTSLVSMGHRIHAFRLLDVEYLSLSLASSIALLTLLITGALLAWRRGEEKLPPSRLWHIRLGQATGLLLVIITVTTLDFEFNLLGQPNRDASHPIPAVHLAEPLQPGSLDQARQLVRQATGTLPKGAYIHYSKGKVKFSEAGDGIGGRSVWVDTNTMTIKRITDWRNDRQALMFILHDGRWLGGLNAFNVNDTVALILLWLVLGGVALYLSRERTVT